VPPPAPPDRAERLATALWFTDTFRTAETERIKQWNEAVCRVQELEARRRRSSEPGDLEPQPRMQRDRRTG
jgi:hypothetical protein